MADLKFSYIRGQFPALAEFTYLNAAAGSPVCRYASEDAMRFYQEMGRYGDEAWPGWVDRTEAIRVELASLLGVPDPDDVAFVGNSSTAMNLFSRLLPSGGTIVTARDEFPTSTVPWLHRGYELVFVESDGGVISPDAVIAKVTADTRAVVLSAVQYGTGFRMDWAAVGADLRARGVPLILNATQACGVVPIDVVAGNVDMLCGTGLKWLAAGYGAGFCYVRRELLERAGLPDAGWQSVADPGRMDNRNIQLRKGVRAAEVGCLPFATIFALGGSLRLLGEVGMEIITQRVDHLRSYLRTHLNRARWSVASPERGAGITLLMPKFELDVQAAVARLYERSIIVGARCGGIRVSTHYYNNEADIHRVLEALDSL